MVLLVENRVHEALNGNGFQDDWFSAEAGPFIVKRKRPSLYRADSNDNIEKSTPDIRANDIACGMFWNTLALIACFCATFFVKIFLLFKRLVFDLIGDNISGDGFHVLRHVRAYFPVVNLLEEKYNALLSTAKRLATSVVDNLTAKNKNVTYRQLKRSVSDNPGFAVCFGVLFCGTTIPVFIMFFLLFCAVSSFLVGFLLFEGTLLTLGTLMMGGVLSAILFVVASVVVFVGFVWLLLHHIYNFIVDLNKRILNSPLLFWKGKR